jgi:4-diphosphocytidyl-2-C-methyl-D-erythritol kinase
MTADAGRRTPDAVFLAPAKINWHLAVGGKRADGYHEIYSHFETIDLCDKLHVQISDQPGGLTLITPEGIPDDGRNTIAKADAALRRARPELPAVRVRLEKEIPHEAGLGGGSSDAAVYLLALNARAHLALSHQELTRLALEAGSDVPFFLHGGHAIVRGRGERVTERPDEPPADLLLILPRARSATPDAYRMLHRPAAGEFPLPEFIGRAELRDRAFLDRCANDFEAVMPDEVLAPQRAIRRLGERPFLSGSGAASFAWFHSEPAAEYASRELSALFPFVRIVRTLSRKDFMQQFA